MIDAPRISAQEAHKRVAAGHALLVCAYEEPEKFAALHLDGALSIQEFRKLRATLPKDQEVIFYCA